MTVVGRGYDGGGGAGVMEVGATDLGRAWESVGMTEARRESPPYDSAATSRSMCSGGV